LLVVFSADIIQCAGGQVNEFTLFQK